MEKKEMVYSVIGGIDYEGCDYASLKLFDCKSSADKYQKQLVEIEGYDYALNNLQEIDYTSALAV